MHLPFHIVIFL